MGQFYIFQYRGRVSWNNSKAPGSRGLGGLGTLEPLMTICMHLVEI